MQRPPSSFQLRLPLVVADPEWEPLERRQDRSAALRRWLADYFGEPRVVLAAGDGPCDDCGADVDARARVGRFVVCRRCALSRQRAVAA